MIQWQYFPKCDAPPSIARQVVTAFDSVVKEIDSERHNHASNAVLRHLAAPLVNVGFEVETGKARNQKINVPVLFGRNGRVDKSFDADAYHRAEGFVLEVEAGRGVVNNQFLKDFFQACMMSDVRYLGVAVRNVYKTNRDHDRVISFFDTLYASRRLELPLKGVLVIGY
jgi:hypothetical protein